QLEQAVRLVMEALEKNPPRHEQRPAYPNYHKGKQTAPGAQGAPGTGQGGARPAGANGRERSNSRSARPPSIAPPRRSGENSLMIVIRFPNLKNTRLALGFLAGRFPFTSWSRGEMLVPAVAGASLAVEGISFSVEGPAKYGQAVPAFRGAPPAPF